MVTVTAKVLNLDNIITYSKGVLKLNLDDQNSNMVCRYI